MSVEVCLNELPCSAGGGVDATSRRSSEATFEWSGRGGVVKNSWTTPPRLHELMRLRDFS